MKKIMKIAFVTAFAAIAGCNVYSYKQSLGVSDLILANVEALATPEQPNTDDCISDPNYDCEALHPTDPSLDNRRESARW